MQEDLKEEEIQNYVNELLLRGYTVKEPRSDGGWVHIYQHVLVENEIVALIDPNEFARTKAAENGFKLISRVYYKKGENIG